MHMMSATQRSCSRLLLCGSCGLVAGGWHEFSGQSLPITMFFFFQAEDGIRDSSVTGVQTCALPISRRLQDQSVVLNAIAVPPTTIAFNTTDWSCSLRVVSVSDSALRRL